MTMQHTSARPVFIGQSEQKPQQQEVRGGFVSMLGDSFYKIENYDAMEPFFISVVSSSDHWLFAASTGGLTAGRVDASRAIFPYYTADKITENSENTGSKTILMVERAGRVSVWEPFSNRQRGAYAITRNIYKNIIGSALVFEEINHDLALVFRYAWRSSEKFGFVKTSWLGNTGAGAAHARLLDGAQNILPAHVMTDTQNTLSVLLDAYKRSELHPQTGLGIFALNSTLTDLAEPSESLLATAVAQVGLAPAAHLLSSVQLDGFRAGRMVTTETEARGRRGAYFVCADLDLPPGQERSWHFTLEGQQDGAAIVQAISRLQGDPAALCREIEDDILAGQKALRQIVARADGLQLSGDPQYDAHHFANAMFNIMRGGIFADEYLVKTADFADFVAAHSPLVMQAQAGFFASLPASLHIAELRQRAAATAQPDLIRLSSAFLPLTFSRRHGDPSRPWNRFAINIKKPDGGLRLDYEGNWRDIFQNWEALAFSYPEFAEGMVCAFLNATTADGYNPYRITHRGIDWEKPEPGNPWANIGYWSDHQIIYLQKLMEASARLNPGRLSYFLARPMFSHAHVPYRIKRYEELLKDPYNTIEFDRDLDERIQASEKERGTDARLVRAGDGVLHVSLAEKLLTLTLAKMANFVPEGGIWMNTQRPEWNDANNALVGKGLSVVTLGYLRRWLAFCEDMLARADAAAIDLSAEVAQFFARAQRILAQFEPALDGAFSDEQRRAMMDALGGAGSDYRWNFYQNGFSGERVSVTTQDMAAFMRIARRYVEHSLRANKRADALFHSYNILHLAQGRASVGHLYEMLEGQASILSSGWLSAQDSLALLNALPGSRLYRPDQHTYILYPDRVLPGFVERNSVSAERVKDIALFAALANARDKTLVARDERGAYHFCGHIHNAKDVSAALTALGKNPRYAALAQAEAGKIHALFEEVFHHTEFTGRSGTFFAYEGLGSVYWHMVAKLLLAAQETAIRLKDAPCAAELKAAYSAIRAGMCFNKPPREYGAFPADPYSHTPAGQGAKQPGMTGAVKEMLLTRQAELGLTAQNGRLVFDPFMLNPAEFLAAPSVYEYVDVRGRAQEIVVPAGGLACSICQTPVVLVSGPQDRIAVYLADGACVFVEGVALDEATTRRIFLRDARVHHLLVTLRLA